MRMMRRCLKMGLFSSLLAGCMVGPNFHKPAAPDVVTYNANPLPAKTAQAPYRGTAGKPQYFVRGRNLPADWWTLYHSPALNELIIKGLANSPNLIAAQTALRQAQENLRAQIGNSLIPAFDATVGGQREGLSGSAFGGEIPSSIFNLFNATVNVSYTLDVFGGARRQIEALQAQVDYQQFQVLATYLSLTSNIVTTAVTIASLEGQIDATRALIQEQEKQLAIIKKQYRLGGVANTNVLSQQTLVNQTRATLPPLQKSLSQSRHALAVLIGDYPNQQMPAFQLDNMTLPITIPVSLPSELVRQRPDVRASEALLHAASAQVGVATANLFPQFKLSGTYYGWESSVPSGLFSAANLAWGYGGSLTQPVFHGGALRAQRRAAIAAYEQAAAQYKQTVLQAFQNVADSLRALDTDARAFRDQRQAELAAYNNLRITKKQYQLGGVSYLSLLTAQQQYQQTRIARIQAQAARYTDTAALYQSLGGGWWNRTPVCGKDPINPANASLSCP